MSDRAGRRRPTLEELRAEMRSVDWAPGLVREDEARREALRESLLSHLEDGDVERVNCFSSRFFSMSIATINGVPLDPYTLADFHRAVDEVAAMIPLSGWVRIMLRVRVVLHSTVGGGRPAMSLHARFVDPRMKRRGEPDAELPAHAAITAELRKRIEPVLPRGRQSEPRLLDIVVSRRRRGG